jgi:hypothetical protein
MDRESSAISLKIDLTGSRNLAYPGLFVCPATSSAKSTSAMPKSLPVCTVVVRIRREIRRTALLQPITGVAADAGGHYLAERAKGRP